MSILVLIAVLIIGYLLLSALIGVTFNLLGFVVSLLIWGIIGWAAGKIMRGAGYGTLTNIALGLGGGIVGSFLFRLLGSNLGDSGLIGSIIVGIIGSIVLIVIGRVLRRA
jgi:uncharacterized membrane protein YeaQ/YmgE (transglycosylase-associated protein family)